MTDTSDAAVEALIAGTAGDPEMDDQEELDQGDINIGSLSEFT